MDHAHRQGVIHRDLRPGNVLVTEQGMAKVADFGTSRFLEIAAHGTTVIGSPPYMAPEQFQGKAVFASDIYSLGVTMYQMLTGSLPYDTPAPGDLERLMRGELTAPPRARNAEDPQRDQRHRDEGDGAGHPGALSAGVRRARSRAGGARAPGRGAAGRGATGASRRRRRRDGPGARRRSTTPRPARMSTTFRRASRRAKRRRRGSAGIAARRCTRAPTSARSAARSSKDCAEWTIRDYADFVVFTVRPTLRDQRFAPVIVRFMIS